MKKWLLLTALAFLAFCFVGLFANTHAAERLNEEGAPLPVTRQDHALLTFVPLGEASENEWVTNQFDEINRYFTSRNYAAVQTASEALPGTIPLFAAFGTPGLDELVRRDLLFQAGSNIPDQGFVIERRQSDSALVCWSPTALGLRYGLIEILRSFRSNETEIFTTLERKVDFPEFPVRIFYVNFASHLQNAYNVNAIFDTDVNRWSREQWYALVDQISAMRYTHFEFWLVPSLMSPDALTGGKLQVQFAETMNQVAAYAKSRGVRVHPTVAVNTVGKDWHYHCPNVPEEKAELLALWEHWVQTLSEIDSWCIGPGDPGGCTKNGCTKKTYVDLALEIAGRIHQIRPQATVEVNTWGEPMSGWGEPLWTSNEKAAKEGMDYLIEKLPEFPPKTLVSINIGFSPDCDPTMLAWQKANGDGRPWARRAAELFPVLTWDYSVTEGEETVYPHCRIRRQITARQREREAGCYSGGIAYTMSPLLQLCSQFGAAEVWWNPDRAPEAILTDFARLALGENGSEAGPLLEEFECLPGWGYEPAPFAFTPERLYDAMSKLLDILNRDDLASETQIPFAVRGAEYRESLIFYAALFRDLADLSISLERLTAMARETGGAFADVTEETPLAEIEKRLSDAVNFEKKSTMQEVCAHIHDLNAEKLRARYWKKVYGIYDVVDAPVDPRSWNATNTLMNRFGARRIISDQASPASRLP